MAELVLVLVYSGIFGITMKIADLLNEHGLKFFKGDSIIFGFLWGIFGSLLVTSDSSIANLILATVVGFIPRMKIDYINHVIAASIIIIVFLLYQTFVPMIFFPFFLIFVTIGTVRDFIRKLSGGKSEISFFKNIFKKFYYVFYYDIFSYVPLVFIYSFMTSNWMLFYFGLTNSLFYNIAKF